MSEDRRDRQQGLEMTNDVVLDAVDGSRLGLAVAVVGRRGDADHALLLESPGREIVDECLVSRRGVPD